MSLSLSDLKQMTREHDAWLAFMQQFKLCCPNVDFNEEHALHAAVTLWGEELHRLRTQQDDRVCREAYEVAVDLYSQHIGFLPSGY